ncbi:ATP-dependent DNA ligase [Salinimonas marina]|uniref:ATP-dependent DNA ligase n=2 Tax=Salinimonas marina TaxID=2785918 RepID=A0A7S9E072_9ALTE|nr:ATP-dependent DNA ligase [Salinimonas marina]
MQVEDILNAGTYEYGQELFTTHSNGDIGSWKIEVFNINPYPLTRTTATKKLGGKPVVTDSYTAEGKNIGRANETTPLEQAISEAKSKVSKKLDKGYTYEMPEPGQRTTNALGFIKPMLAQPIEKVKAWNYPVLAQPKMDGHRMLATVKDGQVVLYSRQGKVLDVEHIRADLQTAFDCGIWEGETLDGEVYAHGETLQRISSLVKKPKPESRHLCYCLYDVVRDMPYPSRHEVLSDIHANMVTTCVTVTETTVVLTDRELNDLHAKYIGMGYEGTIVRQGIHSYEDGKRSPSLMKKKDFQDAEFEITGHQTGKRNERHDLDVGIYICRAPNGIQFSVTAPGDMYEKHRHAQEAESNYGKMLTVKFFNYTPDGIPFHPVALRIREDV